MHNPRHQARVLQPKRGGWTINPLRISPGKLAALEACGMNVRELARRLAERGHPITYQAISLWPDIPYRWLLDVHAATGVPKHILAPKLFEGYVQKDEPHGPS